MSGEVHSSGDPSAQAAAAGDNQAETRLRGLMGRLILALLLLVVLVLLLTVRSCSFVNLRTFVEPAAGGEVSTEQCLDCHSDKQFTGRGKSHDSEIVPCFRCHRQHELPTPGGDPDGWNAFLISSQKELCVICHQSVGRRYDDVNQHPSFELGECTVCHDPHGSEFPAMLVGDPETFCRTCHFLFDSMSRPVGHEPFTSGDCLGCHDPHASDYPGMTKAAQPEVCTGCHQSLSREMAVQMTHEPVGRRCTDCHEPHTADYARLLLAPPPDLCYRCHGQVRAEFSLASRHPVPQGLNCTSCHFPHTSPHDSLLLAGDNDLCRRCHEQKVISTAGSEHGLISREGRPSGSCRNCHLWHGSDAEPLLPEWEVDLCGRCHERKTHPQTNHPHDRPYWDDWHRQTMRCSSCHDPHDTPNPAMTHKAKDGLCLTCHPGVGVTF
ncbi:MAG: hypothetical protein Kow00129_10780 [Thermoleophilia bacterium]